MGPNAMAGLSEVDLQRAGAPAGALEALTAACRRVGEGLSPGGWVLTHELAASAPGQVVVRLAMLRDEVVVSGCGFVIGPGRAVAFERPADRGVSGLLDAMGEAEFHRLIALWAGEVQAGVAHSWHYEAVRHGRPPN
jgi:hypothetical protein